MSAKTPKTIVYTAPEGVTATEWAAFMLSPAWARLTENQKQFFIVWKSTGSPRLATQQIYGGDSKQLAGKANSAMHSRRFVKAREFFEKELPKLVLLQELKRTMSADTSAVARVQAAQLYARLTGMDSADTDTPAVDAEPHKSSRTTVPPRHYVGELFSQNGVHFRATKISVDGGIEEAEELNAIR